ncbi:MAG: iron chelate uptake ABC transporter family permease subunit [Candidatus Eisenbacteria bacterium]|nr:iron chelate uptake ABC transporter family permease subunit [Candidatus Latescibacterota bacterium]MBD3303241.1 iron chelate uptake ABC transporter family permease subunit [Candidatus Eisenbacteria bacterium]
MIEALFEAVLGPLGEGFFQKALLGGALVAIPCSVVGCLVILRRMAFLGDALSHAMLAGVTGGYLFMRLAFGIAAHAAAMLIGSVLAALMTVFMINFISRVSRLKEDTSIGIMYTGVFAFGGVLASFFAEKIHIDLVHFVLGHVLAVDSTDLWVSGIVAGIVLSTILLFYRQFQVTTFDPVMATSLGIPVAALNALLTADVSFVVVSGVGMVGVILVVGLLITPAATALLLSTRLSRMMLLAAVFGLTSVIGGLYFSLGLNVSGGSAIILFCTVQFLVVFTVAPRHGLLAGWLRKRRMVPQQMIEDILRAALRADSAGGATRDDIVRYLHGPHSRLEGALRRMQREGVLTREGDRHRLTEHGRFEARRILRAHRLWETYLHRMGTPDDRVHETAHQLEHVHDEESVDYLDDRLGHPVLDPHGSPIPADFVHATPGREVRSSLLRDGDRAVVVAIGPIAQESPLRLGTVITAGPREDDGDTWTFRDAQGTEIRLDHEQADEVRVEVLEVSRSDGD